MRTPACMHRGRDRSLEERYIRNLTVVETTSFASGAPYHMPPVLFATVPLLSHTYSLWEPGKGGRSKGQGGDDDMGRWLFSYIQPPKHHPHHMPLAFPCTAHLGVLPPQPGSMWRGQNRDTSPGSLPSHIMPEKHLY